MKPMGWLGVVLLVAGLAFLVFPVMSFTTREEVVDIGPVEITHEETERVPIPAIAAGAAVAAGLVLIVTGRRH